MDTAVFHLINNLAGGSSVADAVVLAWARLGPLVLTALASMAWMVLPARDRSIMPRRLALISIAAAVVALGIAQGIGHEWFRTRPYLVVPAHLLVPPSADPSFPSDHAVGAFALATPLLLDRQARGLGLAVLTGAIALALSRVFIGTHYPSDVLGGAALGSGVALVLVWVATLVDRHAPVLWMPARSASHITEQMLRVIRHARRV
ncbi:MAG: phosphatase PAP2 family protein [Dehalococcoidia bacterium]|nr:MAG: phosphatase PAP2 family protein [Dehalococcoidia bacterium]